MIEEWKQEILNFWAKKPTEEEIFEALEEEGSELLWGAPSELLADRKFMLKAVKKCGLSLEYASDELKNDEKIVLAAIQGGDEWGTRYAFAFEYASEELRSNKEFVLKAVKVSEGLALDSASEELKNDKDVVLMAVSHGEEPSQFDPITALQFASTTMRADKDVVLAAVKRNGWCLADASEELKADKEVVMAATINSPWSLTYASSALRADKEFILEVVRHTGYALQYVSDELKADKEVVLVAVRQDADALYYASEQFKADKEFILEVVRHTGNALRYVSDELKADKEVVLIAVRQGTDALHYASEQLKADKEVVLTAAITHPWSLRHASANLLADKEFAIELVQTIGKDALKYIDEALRNDRGVLFAAACYTPSIDRYLYDTNKIVIPATVTGFEQGGLWENIDSERIIESIIVKEGNPVYHSAGNCLIETESKTLILGCKNSIIPDDGSVEKIDRFAFAECNGLKSLHIPASVKEIDNGAFGGFGGRGTCYDLECITVSPDNDNFRSINDEVLIGKYIWDEELTCIVFVGKNVKSFTWPADVRGYYDGAFSACSGLESLSVDPKNPWLYSVNNCVVDREYSLLLTCCNSSVIPDDGSIIGICSGAFSGVKLKSLHIPSSIGELSYDNGIAPFTGCLGIENITVSDGNQYYCSINNCLIEKDSKYLVYGGKNCIIPDDGSVEYIANEAFFGTEFTNITIPSPIRVITSLAFGNCSNLTTVVMSNSVTWIESNAFIGCNRLSRVFYLGTESDRENIVIEIEDEPINFATWFYYSEEKPKEEGNYWHYFNGEPTVW